MPLGRGFKFGCGHILRSRLRSMERESSAKLRTIHSERQAILSIESRECKFRDSDLESTLWLTRAGFGPVEGRKTAISQR